MTSRSVQSAAVEQSVFPAFARHPARLAVATRQRGTIVPPVPEHILAGDRTRLRWWKPSDAEVRSTMIAGNRTHLAAVFDWAAAHTYDTEVAWLDTHPRERARGVFHYAIIGAGTPVGAISVYLDLNANSPDELAWLNPPPAPGVVASDAPWWPQTAEIGFWVDAAMSGLGYAQRAVTAVTGALHGLGIPIVYAITDPDNHAGKPLARAGFVRDEPTMRFHRADWFPPAPEERSHTVLGADEDLWAAYIPN